MNKRYLVAAVGAALAVAGPAAFAVEAKISGQVNRGIMQVDDGTDSELIHVDTDTSSTRFRFTGSEEIMPGLKAGIVWEVEYQSNDSSVVTPTVRDSAGPSFGERKMEVYFQGGFGQVSLGQGDGAANGAIEVDLSGTSVVSYAGTADVGGAVAFVGGPTLGSVIGQQDFESRYDRLRYDTPTLGPVVLSVSSGTKDTSVAIDNGDVAELAAWLNFDLGAGGKLAAALGSSTKELGGATGDVETTGGSVSWLAPFGLNVTLARSNLQNDAGRDSDFTYAKVGYKVGPHAVSVDYALGEDEAAVGDEATHTGVQYVYVASKAVEVYGGYKTISLDRAVGSFDDITIALIGSRIKF